MTVGSVALTSLLIGVALQPFLIPWLRRRGVMDTPNKRSSHHASTPRGGGIAVVAALGAGLLVGRQGGWDVAVVFVGAMALGAVGLADDFRGLSARVRLGMLLVGGAIAGLLLSSPLPLIMSVAAMALWATAYVNAFNFMDGINGVSGMSGVVAGVSYVGMGLVFESETTVVVGAALTGACLSFLPFNIPRAKVFLGDVGSYSIGFVIATLGWITWAAGAPLVVSFAPTAVYLTDTGVTLFRRARAGQPLMEAHRSHIYQTLVVGGHNHVSVALLVAGLEAGTVALVWGAEALGLPWLGIALAALGLGWYVDLASPRRVRQPTSRPAHP